MKIFEWDSLFLKEERGVSFEDVVFHIQNGDLLDTLNHPNFEKYLNQKIFVLSINQYVYYVLFVENENACFLKTIIPSRKLLKA